MCIGKVGIYCMAYGILYWPEFGLNFLVDLVENGEFFYSMA